MAALKGTILASKIVPTDSLDTYATHEDVYGRGGHRSVDTIVERDEISPERRKEGMTVYVKEDKTKYILENGVENTYWKVDSSGGSGGGDVDLSDYYKKTETYSKVEVDTKISDIPETDLTNYYNKTQVDTIALDKVDKVAGKQLSTEDYTTAEKNKLANLTDNFKGGYVDSTDRDGSLANPKDNWYILQHDTDTIWYYKNSAWVDTGNKSTGDMLKAIYDPTGKNADSFLMSNMVETLDAKIMTSAERTKLDSIEEGAQVNTVFKVNNKTGNVMLDKNDVGLNRVDNTPDNEKSVATAGRLTLPVKINGVEFSGNEDIEIKFKTINNQDILGVGNINIETESSLPAFTEDDKNKVLTINEVSGAPSWQPSKGGSDSSTFTGTAAIDVGGVKAGDSWDNAPISDVVNAIINPELFPTFVNPTFSFTSTVSGFKEVGSVTDITFNVNFSRGSITPQYSAENNYRSGLPTTYNYSGPVGSEAKANNTLTDTKTITGYSIAIGSNTFSCSVDYSIGTQPKSSKGNNYNTPLPAGTLSAKSITITGVYPVYSGIGTLSKIPLQAHGTAIVVDAPADMNVGGNRFTIQYPNVWSVKTPVVQQENELSKAWDNQNMLEYEITDINISGVSYRQVKYVGSGIGVRKLRLVF